MPLTIDMWTSGDMAGQIKRPMVYTTDEDEATRVKVWLQLATPAGKYKFATDEGLDHVRILTAPTDEERAALVRDVVLSDPRVESIAEGPTVTIVDQDGIGPTAVIELTAQTISGAIIPLGLTLGA